MKKILAVAFAVSCAMRLNAQQTEYRRCDTDHMWNQLIRQDPEVKERNDALHANTESIQRIKEYIKQRTQQRGLSGTPQFRIPVVFHVIHTYGSENISKAQIEDAVRILNLSFQKLNPDTGMVIPLFQPIFADCEIEFALATIDPSGNCTDGITRTYSPLTAIAGDNVKALIDWPSDKYFNIWVVQNIASGAAGYAYYPGANPAVDGVVIRSDYVGSIGTSNGSNYTERSLTHEVGHWLDLPHTWGSSNTPGIASNCTIDDGISDTPNTIGVDDFSCNTAQNTCGQTDNVQNYMDYASCHYMFTEGQKTRMHVALWTGIGDRYNLWQPANLLATGTDASQTAGLCKPQSDFNAAPINICQGSSQVFKDASWGGAVDTRLWLFPGGTPASDTAANPVVTYSTPGTYSVTLITYNASGSDTIVRTNHVTVIPTPGVTAIPAAESFETMGSLAAGNWSVVNTTGPNSWVLFSGAGATGSFSARINNSVNADGFDALISPTYNASNISAAQLSFKFAFAAKNSNDASALKVYTSSDCGSTWNLRLNKSGAALRTAPNNIGAFVPTSAQWTTQTVNLVAQTFSGQPTVLVKFEFTNDQGNNIYLDDINISGVVGTGEELAALYQFEAFPNPATDQMIIRLQSDQQADVNFDLMDLTGRSVSRQDLGKRTGQITGVIDGKQLSGVYLLRISVNGNSFTRRVVFID